MRFVGRVLLILVGILLLLIFVVPFVIPIPPLQDVVPPKELADPDSRFVKLNGLEVHYKQRGEGQPLIVLLHGFGASTFSWREVLAPLAAHGTVVAFDRPGFGLTSRPMPGDWSGQNPYSAQAQADLVIALLDQFGAERAILVGNSAGGTIAMLTALTYPDRVEALVLVDAAIYTQGGSPGWAQPLLNLPSVRRIGPLVARSLLSRSEAFLQSAWHDPSQITPAILAGYARPTQAKDWDKALWELTMASGPLGLPARLEELQLPILVITGDDDRIVPTAESVRLAEELPEAELAVIPNCGHLPQEECPQAFLEAVEPFIASVEEE